MQIVPIIPQPVTGVEESPEVKGIAAVKAAKPVQQRTLPPLVTYPHEHRDSAELKVVSREQRQPAQLEERRVMCRRVYQTVILQELRSQFDRRRRNQRGTDQLLHIDEEV